MPHVLRCNFTLVLAQVQLFVFWAAHFSWFTNEVARYSLLSLFLQSVHRTLFLDLLGTISSQGYVSFKEHMYLLDKYLRFVRFVTRIIFLFYTCENEGGAQVLKNASYGLVDKKIVRTACEEPCCCLCCTAWVITVPINPWNLH